MARKRVLLTGASGTMGGEAFKELQKRKDCDITLLVRPSRKNKRAFQPYADQKEIRVVWGDLCHPIDVQRAVVGADYILHAAAMIPPAADHHPRLCQRINVDGTCNLISAIRQMGTQGEHIRFIYVSSVALYGDRLPSIHIGRVGDPLKPAVGDIYAATKMAAERAVIESGLKYWAVLRQTYIAIPKALSLLDPIMFHQPLDSCMELITSADAGYGLTRCLDVPDEFFGQVYNMSGGPSCRVVYRDYLARLMKIFGVGDYRKTMDRNWFALGNFHCCWFADSQGLNDYLGHWRQSLENHYQQVAEATPGWIKGCIGLIPSAVIKAYLKRMAGPLKCMKTNEKEKIQAFFKDRRTWMCIPDWNGDQCAAPSPQASGPGGVGNTASWETPQALARARGGACLSAATGDLESGMTWRCAFGHEWVATTVLIRAGHWCPQCAPPPWDYDAIARVDPLFARFYQPIGAGSRTP